MKRPISNFSKQDILALLSLMVIGVLLFAPMMHRWRLMGDYGGDANKHNEIAFRVIEDPAGFFRNTPHFLYHVLTAAFYKILPGHDIYVAGVWVMVLSYLALMAILYIQARRIINPAGSMRRALLLMLVVSTLMLIAPITFFTPDNHYFGYFVPHVYHNPTINIMKPFAMALFFVSLPLFRNIQKLSWRWFPAYALLTGLCLIAKPSFILAFVPALGLVTLFYSVRALFFPDDGVKRNLVGRVLYVITQSAINWPVLMGGIVIPAFLILIYQALTWTSSGGISVEPLRVFYEWTLHYDQNADQFLLGKLILSVAFPLAVYAFYVREASRELMFNMAWVIFGISIAYSYLLVDQTVIAAGDFNWSAQIAVLILHVSAAFFLLQRYQSNADYTTIQKMTLAVSVMILALHLLSGIYWYYLHMTQDALTLIYGAW